jgi:nucleoid-associated protein YgaU
LNFAIFRRRTYPNPTRRLHSKADANFPHKENIMKKPILVYSALALVAAGSVVAGTAWKSGYLTKNPAPAVVEAAAPVVPEKPKDEKVAIAETPAPAVVTEAPKSVVPSFDTVRVESTGNAVIAGRAEPGADVVAMLNGSAVATAKAGPDGSFVMIPDKPLPPGTGALTLQATLNGAQSSSEQTVAVNIKTPEVAPVQAAEAPKTDAPKTEASGNTVAVLSPSEPTKILQAPAAPSDSVTLDAVDYDTVGNIVFSGRAAPLATVRIYVDNAQLADAMADDKGKWSFSGKSDIVPGNHQLRVDQLSADGKVASRVELPFTREEPAKVAEAAPPPADASKSADATKPADQPVTPVVPVVQKITIQPGNNLWKLSRQLYGFGSRYTVIFEANKDVIRNPELIYPGQVLTAPQKAVAN